ncbi:ribonuclease H2 subunit B [Manduca sexta]|uniref:ribonuclease H2 subunit B n=1 Tax=Manduca sexta TaxID=7130 RepID=UPI00188FFB9A|nr:ribonuclease H2 subunit B [Manduca sexta]
MSTRSKRAKEAAQTNKVIYKRVENSWVLLVRDSLLENNNFSIVTLPHPAHSQPSKYCLDDNQKKIFEVVTFKEPHRSWFIGDTVKSDGSLQILTPINPLFLVLPRLREQCSDKAIPLEDLLSEKGFNRILDYVPQMDSIADLKGPPDLKAYKYNEEKTLNWLEERVRKLSGVLREKNIHVTSGAVSATFVTSKLENDNIDEEFYLRYAHGVISEYIQDDLMQSLEKRFNFKPELIETIGHKRKSEEESDSKKEVKKIKREKSEAVSTNELAYSQVSPEVKKPKTLTSKEKARQKAASGTKTISSFFMKK